jgi:hypothetical protein
LSDDARAVLARAAAQTDAHVDTGHLLLGLLAHDPDALAESGVTEQQVRAETARLLAEFLRGRPANVDAGKADELIAAPRVSVPADIRALDEKIADTRRAKEAAIDAEEFETAGRIRDHEKQLLSQRAERVRDWAAGIDVLALAEEVEALRAEVDRLRTHRHDNNADENRT